MAEQKGNYDLERIKVEHAALQKYAAIQKATEDKIGVQKIYIDMTGDIEAAFVLDELIFFTLPRHGGKSALRAWKGGYLWMAVQRAEWWDRKRLTPRQADRAIDKLEALGLIIKDVFKFNAAPTTHLRLNISKFFELYSAELEKQNPPEDPTENVQKDLDDLYEMMGIPKSPNGNLPNGETESPNGETESPNGENINTPHHPPLIPPGDLSEITKAANRKVDAYLQLAQSPGIKTQARIDSILSYLGGKLRINTETKRWKEFAKFVDNRQRTYGEGLDVFVTWLMGQKNFDIQFWPPAKMAEMWPQAFIVRDPLVDGSALAALMGD